MATEENGLARLSQSLLRLADPVLAAHGLRSAPRTRCFEGTGYYLIEGLTAAAAVYLARSARLLGGAALPLAYDPLSDRAHYDPGEEALFVGTTDLIDLLAQVTTAVAHETQHAVRQSAQTRRIDHPSLGLYSTRLRRSLPAGYRDGPIPPHEADAFLRTVVHEHRRAHSASPPLVATVRPEDEALWARLQAIARRSGPARVAARLRDLHALVSAIREGNKVHLHNLLATGGTTELETIARPYSREDCFVARDTAGRIVATVGFPTIGTDVSGRAIVGARIDSFTLRLAHMDDALREKSDRWIANAWGDLRHTAAFARTGCRRGFYTTTVPLFAERPGVLPPVDLLRPALTKRLWRMNAWLASRLRRAEARVRGDD